MLTHEQMRTVVYASVIVTLAVDVVFAIKKVPLTATRIILGDIVLISVTSLLGRI